jgi:hypothetical protein
MCIYMCILTHTYTCMCTHGPNLKGYATCMYVCVCVCVFSPPHAHGCSFCNIIWCLTAALSRVCPYHVLSHDVSVALSQVCPSYVLSVSSIRLEKRTRRLIHQLTGACVRGCEPATDCFFSVAILPIGQGYHYSEQWYLWPVVKISTDSRQYMCVYVYISILCVYLNSGICGLLLKWALTLYNTCVYMRTYLFYSSTCTCMLACTCVYHVCTWTHIGISVCTCMCLCVFAAWRMLYECMFAYAFVHATLVIIPICMWIYMHIYAYILTDVYKHVFMHVCALINMSVFCMYYMCISMLVEACL